MAVTVIRRLLLNMIIIAAAVCAGAFAAEIVYRVRIALINDHDQLYVLQPRIPSVIGAFSRSAWVYDEKEGFRYAKDAGKIMVAAVAGGVLSCVPHPDISIDGAPGKAEGDYAKAEIKIAVFSDSFGLTAAGEDGESWPFLLQRELSARAHRIVHVYNAAHDGYGLLQIFDTAALRVDELRPDLVILAYATGNMQSPRIWRQEATVNGDARVLTTFVPGPPDLARAVDTMLLAPEITPDACSNPTKQSSAVRAVVDRYLRIRPEQQSILALDRSFLWNRFRYKTPVHLEKIAQYAAAPLTADNVEHDVKLAADATKLHSYPAPIVLLHTPYLPEIQTGRFPVTDAEQHFLRMVEQRSGFRSISMMQAMPHFDDPASLAYSAENLHPSAKGRRAYAMATAEILLDRFPTVFFGDVAALTHNAHPASP